MPSVRAKDSTQPARCTSLGSQVKRRKEHRIPSPDLPPPNSCLVHRDRTGQTIQLSRSLVGPSRHCTFCGVGENQARRLHGTNTKKSETQDIVTKSKPYLPLGYDCNGNTVRARRCGQYSTLISMTGLRMSHRDRQIVLLTTSSDWGAMVNSSHPPNRFLHRGHSPQQKQSTVVHVPADSSTSRHIHGCDYLHRGEAV